MFDENKLRGEDLLITHNLTRDNICHLEFKTKKFSNHAAVNAWCKNFGFETKSLRSLGTTSLMNIREEKEFDKNSFRLLEIAKGVIAKVGDLIDDFTVKHDASDYVLEDIEFKKLLPLYVKKEDKTDEELMKSVTMFGIVMVPEVPDSVGDVASEEIIEKANHSFMTGLQTIGEMHKFDASDRIVIIQNAIAPTDISFQKADGSSKEIKKGTWYQELYSEDEEIVKAVREGRLTGLSIGGWGKKEKIAKRENKSITIYPKNVEKSEFHDSTQILKFFRRINKKEGDEALNRFIRLRVDEVSVVDKAANEEEFFIIKRRNEPMNKKTTETKIVKNENEDVEVKPAEEEKPQEEVSNTPPIQTDPPTNDPPIAAIDMSAIQQTIADAVQAGVSQAIQQMQKTAEPEPKEIPVEKKETDLEKMVKGLVERFESVEQNLKEVQTLKSVAKGESIPEKTAEPEPVEEVKESIWAGSALDFSK